MPRTSRNHVGGDVIRHPLTRPTAYRWFCLLGRNDWGNLRRHVVTRRGPLVVGFVVADLGEYQMVAVAEDGMPLFTPISEWVGVDSPRGIERMEQQPCGTT